MINLISMAARYFYERRRNTEDIVFPVEFFVGYDNVHGVETFDEYIRLCRPACKGHCPYFDTSYFSVIVIASDHDDVHNDTMIDVYISQDQANCFIIFVYDVSTNANRVLCERRDNHAVLFWVHSLNLWTRQGSRCHSIVDSTRRKDREATGGRL